MRNSQEQTLIDDGGIRLRCSEPSKIKCTGCGDTSQTSEDWASNDNSCALCDGSPLTICARCECVLDATPLGEHPCQSLDVYRKTKQVVFAAEMIAAIEARAEQERVERERTERERVERERAERERKTYWAMISGIASIPFIIFIILWINWSNIVLWNNGWVEIFDGWKAKNALQVYSKGSNDREKIKIYFFPSCHSTIQSLHRMGRHRRRQPKKLHQYR